MFLKKKYNNTKLCDSSQGTRRTTTQFTSIDTLQ